MWGATFPTEASLDGIMEANARAQRGGTDLIARGHADGSIRTDADAEAGAVVLQGLLRGVAAMLLTEPCQIDIERSRRAVDDWLAAALAP